VQSGSRLAAGEKRAKASAAAPVGDPADAVCTSAAIPSVEALARGLRGRG